jgi:hypothetical protein
MPSGRDVGHSFCCMRENDIFAEHSSAASLDMYSVVISYSICVSVDRGGMPTSYAMVSMVGYPYQNSIRDGSLV